VKRTEFCSVESICLLIYLSNLGINKKPFSTYRSNTYFLKTVFNINLYNLSNKTNWGKKTQFYAFLYMYVMKGLRKKGGTIKGSGLRDQYWIGYSLSVEKTIQLPSKGVFMWLSHSVTSTMTQWAENCWPKEASTVLNPKCYRLSVLIQVPAQIGLNSFFFWSITQWLISFHTVLKCTKCIKGLIYLVQHLSPKMLAHCMDSLVWLSLQCHLSNTKRI